MPATSSIPSIVTPAVTADYWEVVGIDLRPGVAAGDRFGRPVTPAQITVTYVYALGAGQLRSASLTVLAAPYILGNPTVYPAVKRVSYQILTDNGIVPPSASVS